MPFQSPFAKKAALVFKTIQILSTCWDIQIQPPRRHAVSFTTEVYRINQILYPMPRALIQPILTGTNYHELVIRQGKEEKGTKN